MEAQRFAPKEESTEAESSAPDLETEVDEGDQDLRRRRTRRVAGNAHRKFISGR
jgi:hypothetical protein